MSEMCLYVLSQFLGYLFQAIPLIFLVFVPFSKPDFRFGKGWTIAGTAAVSAVLALAAVFHLSRIYEPDMRWVSENTEHLMSVGNLWFSGMLLFITAVYGLGFRKGVRGRVLCYIFGCQYAMTVYIIAEIVSKDFGGVKLGAIRAPYGLRALVVYGVSAIVVCPLVCVLIRRSGILDYRIDDAGAMRRLVAGFVAILAVYTVALLTGVRIYRMSTDDEISMLSVIWLCCMLVAALLVYVIFFFVIRTKDEKGRMEVQLAAFDMQYQAMRDKIQEDQRIHHDMRHHFRTLTGQLERGEAEAAKAYLQAYLKEWESRTEVKPSENPIFNTILEHYIAQAEKEHIQMRQDILIKDSWTFDLMDMTVLLGNAMENAIEACVRSGLEEPVIRFSARQKKQAFLMQIENSCDELPLAIDQKTKLPYSSKRVGKIGYGISSMMGIAEKYMGTVEYWKKDTMFTLRILLYLPEAMQGMKLDT